MYSVFFTQNEKKQKKHKERLADLVIASFVDFDQMY